MLHTHQDQERDVNRPIVVHGHRKPDLAFVIAMVERRITELPATSLRRQVLKRMIARARD